MAKFSLSYARNFRGGLDHLCASLCLTRSMTRCLSVLLFAVFACALLFWSLELQGQFRRFEDPLLKPESTSFFSDFDPGDPINSRLRTII